MQRWLTEGVRLCLQGTAEAPPRFSRGMVIKRPALAGLSYERRMV